MKKEAKILCDIDGVVANCMEGVYSGVYEDFGVMLSHANHNKYNIGESFADSELGKILGGAKGINKYMLHRFFKNPKFYASLKPYWDVCIWLKQFTYVTFVTGRSNSSLVMDATMKWLRHYGLGSFTYHWPSPCHHVNRSDKAEFCTKAVLRVREAKHRFDDIYIIDDDLATLAEFDNWEYDAKLFYPLRPWTRESEHVTERMELLEVK